MATVSLFLFPPVLTSLVVSFLLAAQQNFLQNILLSNKKVTKPNSSKVSFSMSIKKEKTRLQQLERKQLDQKFSLKKTRESQNKYFLALNITAVKVYTTNHNCCCFKTMI
jgi:hypothetical protein